MRFACGPRTDAGCPSRVRTSVHGFKVRCPTIRRRGSGRRSREDPERSPRTRDASRAGKWSGRRDSNPRPSPWQGDALPTEPLPPEIRPPVGGAESQIRTGDTAIFSRVLYQLSYLGPMVNQPSAARRRVERYHGPRAGINAKASWRPSRALPGRPIRTTRAADRPSAAAAD